MSKKLVSIVLLICFMTFILGLTSYAEESIKILGTIPMSGEAGNLGPAYDRAISLAVEEINEAGIDGFSHIDYKIIDNETKPSVLQQKLRREIQRWQPDIAGGCALETTIRVLCEAGPSYNLPTFCGGHLSMAKYMPPGEVPTSKWLAYYGFSDYFAGQLAGQFFEEMGVKKVAFVGGDYDWGYSNGMGLKAYWENNGQPFEIGPVLYTPLDKTDFSTEVAIIRDEKPDALFCPYMGAGWFSFAKQLRDSGAMPDYFLYGTTYSNMGGAKITGAYGAENIYTLADHNPESEEWKNYVKKWKDAYGEEAYPEAYTNNYYQMIYWIVKVFEKAGTKDPETIVDTMMNTSFQNVCISPMGPMGPYGSNRGAQGSIVKFVPGSSELDPSFDLHPELIGIYEVPDKNVVEILEEMKDMKKLETGESYPAK